ncbi:MAG: protein kinase [Myxococcales bacterium]|nr:protein kinase [Myxococcales bacterium]
MNTTTAAGVDTPRRRDDPADRATVVASLDATVAAAPRRRPVGLAATVATGRRGATASVGLADTVARPADATSSDAVDDSAELDPTVDGRWRAPGARPLKRDARIGRLKILRALGEGGMGVVYAAYDPKLDREVAVKLLRGGQDDAAARLRLEREAQALAKLAHPNVVAVHDVGSHDDQLWVSMEFVVGRTLAVWVKEERPSWRQVLSVIQQAGRGIAAAHAEGLLHRDIKPDNIMVGDDGRVRVMDFGLAREDRPSAPSRDRDDELRALSVELTTIGAILGTPAYMAPEQFNGLAVDERTDEFALAVTTWEALYGARPFAGDTFTALRAAVVAGTREPAPSDSNVPAWLRRTLERALDVDRNKRFESVRVMLEAIEHQLQRARARALVAGLSLGLAVMGVLGALAAVQWRRAATNEARAQASEAELRGEKRVVEQQKRVLEERNAALTAREADLKNSLSVQWGLRARALIPENREGEALTLGVQAVGAFAPDWEPAPPREATDALERVLADDTLIVRATTTLTLHKAEVWALALSPDGARLVTASVDDTTRLWDARTGELLIDLPHDEPIRALAYSPDGGHIAGGGVDGGVWVWDARTGAPVATFAGHERVVYRVAYAPDSSRVATASADKTARVWDARTGDRLATLRGHADEVFTLAFSPDSRRVATGSFDKTARIWDAATGDSIATLRGHEHRVSALAYSPDGARLVSASWDKTARLWDAATGASLRALGGHENELVSVEFSPDGAHVATASFDKTARIWDAATGETVAVLKGHDDGLEVITYSPDGARVATASLDKTARIWDARTGDNIATLRGHRTSILALAFGPDGARLATASRDTTARLWDIAPDDRIAAIRGHERELSDVVYSRDGARVVTTSFDRTARLWDVATGDTVATLRVTSTRSTWRCIHPTARASRPRAPTPPRGSGTRRRVSQSSRCADTRTSSTGSRTRPTARTSRPGAPTRPRGSGTRRRGRSWPRSRAMRATSGRWRFSPTAPASRPRAPTRPRGSGTPPPASASPPSAVTSTLS